MIIKKWTGECKEILCDRIYSSRGSSVTLNKRYWVKAWQQIIILLIILINFKAFSHEYKSLFGKSVPQRPHRYHIALFANQNYANINPQKSNASSDLLPDATSTDESKRVAEEDDDDEGYMLSPFDQTKDLEELRKNDESNILNSADSATPVKPEPPQTTTTNLTSDRAGQHTPSKVEIDHDMKNDPYEQQAAQNQVPDLRLVDGAQCAFIIRRPGADCITYSTIDWAVERARRRLNFQQPEGIMRTVELSESSINSIGEVIELSTAILANRFLLTWQEITFELEQVDTARTILWDSCPTVYRSPPSCTLLSRYRTHTGQCNNLIGGHLGSSNMPFIRDLPPDYGDWIGAPRRSSTSGAELPPVRLIALELHPDIERPSADFSVLYMAWGQLLNHDMAMASNARDATGHSGSCCERRSESRVCMPIAIGRNDPLYSRFGIRCHEFKRSLSAIRPGCSLGPRTQLNSITSFIDVSFVYGSSRSAATTLRGSATRGQLQVWDYFERQRLKPLLPPQLENPDEECVGRTRGRFCFQSGDLRTNQQIQLVVLHTIHKRQHNRLARALASLNPHWTDNRIYHEARHIHIALVQHILLTEYLPALLGKRLMSKYKLTEAPQGSYWDGYEPGTNPGISQAFAAAAFRQGHSTVPNQLYRFNNRHELVRAYQLRQTYRQPWPLFEPGAMDEFLLGTLDAPAQSFDPFISSDLSGHLLQLPNEAVGLDLTAINIQRGRDQGIAGYNAFRDWCGLGRVSSFARLKSYMSGQSIQAMASMYDSVDDVDLFTGGISEFPLEGAQVGPTFACIIGRQFEKLRSGDRFWFENSIGPQSFTIPQLDSIRQVSLARLMCANGDNVLTIQQMALHLPHPILNPRQLCDSLPDVDITLWLDQPQQSASSNNNSIVQSIRV